MRTVEERYRLLITIGWICLLQIVILMFLVYLMRSAVDNDFLSWSKDPGEFGLDMMYIVFTIYIFIPILTQIFSAKIFRWFLVLIGILFFLFFVAHQLSHMIIDNTSLSLVHLLDFAHHFLSLWVIVISIRWARLPGSVNEAQNVKTGEFHSLTQAPVGK
ncbi:MAG: hypothetical protein P8Y45_18195 [Exilibacterium sp.]